MSTNKVQLIQSIEKPIGLTDHDLANEWYKPLVKLCYDFGNHQVVWCGFNNTASIILVHNDRQAYTGGIMSHVKNHLENLKKKFNLIQPIFATKSRYSSAFFGEPHIIIPIKPFVCVWSTEIVDSADIDSDLRYDEQNINGCIFRKSKPYSGPYCDHKIYDTYQSIKNNLPTDDFKGELIFDCEKYFLYRPPLNLQKKENLTYQDIAKTLYAEFKRLSIS